jgi:hypothetical protein
MNSRNPYSRETAESLAIQALTFLGSDQERLARFLALSGIGPQSIRTVAREAGFLAGVLEYLATDEALLLAFATEAAVAPEEIESARRVLGAAA